MSSRILIKDLTHYLESIAPLAYQESYDNSGLIIGNGNTAIQKVLVTLDCTEAVVEEAILTGCNLIIAHHPIVFSGLKKLNGHNYVERVVIKAIKNDIAIYAIHTNLDNIHQGVNKKIADQIGLNHTRILAPKSNLLSKVVTFIPTAHLEPVRISLFDAGAGTIGNYDQCSFTITGKGTFRGNELTQPFVGMAGQMHIEEEVRLEIIVPKTYLNGVLTALKLNHPYEEPAIDIYELGNEYGQVGSGMIGTLAEALSAEDFLIHLKKSLHLNIIRYTPFSKTIKTIALCGGSGSFLLKKAIASQADAFVTADFKYHEFFDAEDQLMIADIGHYESEFFTKALLKDLIIKKFNTFAVLLSEINTNPIKYY